VKGLRRVKWLRQFTRIGFPASPRKVRVRAGRFTFPMILIPREHRAIWMGVYEQPVVRALEVLLAPGMVAVDGGAHIGFFTLLMAHRVRPGGRVDVDLVKLDVEGLEAQVLAGGQALIRRCQPALVLELHEPMEDFLEKPMVRELAAVRYTFFMLPSSPPEAPHLVGLPPRWELPGELFQP